MRNESKAAVLTGGILDAAGTLFMCVITGLACGLLLMLLVMLMSQSAWASKVELPQVSLNSTSQGSLLFRQASERGVYSAAPTLETNVSMDVAGMLAYVEVEQSFTNPTDEWQEGVYVFPLPDDSAVNRLRMQIGERIIEGQVKEKAAARKTYEKAKREGRKAALVEQQRPNIFTNSVANIGPGETIKVTIHYQQRLSYRDSEFSLRFPLVVNPRYTPAAGKQLAETINRGESVAEYKTSGWSSSAVENWSVDEAITLERGHPVTIAINLEPGFPVEYVKSLYHGISRQHEGDRHTITLADSAVPADRDFVLAWKPLLGNAPQAALFSEKQGEDQYGLVMFMPPHQRVANRVRQAREIVFVIDTSGSMGGASIRQAKHALELALQRLSPRDRFNIIRFESTTRSLYTQPVIADRSNVSRAIGYVRSLQAGGGTEMRPALMRALQNQGDDGGNVRQVVFLTDGSVSNEDELFNLIKTHLGHSRLFTVGIGSAPNSFFMQRAARFGRGTFTYIGDITEVKESMTALFERIEQPVLSDIKLTWLQAGKPVVSVDSYPDRVADLYAGEPLVISARMISSVDTLRITGKAGEHRWQRELSLKGGATQAGVARRWAREKIAALMDSVHEGMNPEKVRAAVIRVALEHHLVSKYTSLVAVDVTPTRSADRSLSTKRIKTPLPKGSDPATFIGLPQTATPATLQAVTGLVALVLGIMLLWYAGRTGRCRA